MDPIYTPENTSFAFQLNWAVTLFARQGFPVLDPHVASLRPTWEADGLRVLEHRLRSAKVAYFLVSTKPHVSPQSLLRVLKGRLQHAIRDQAPKAFRRNYRLESVGSAKREVVLEYVRNQLHRHPMADQTVAERLTSVQIRRSDIDLSRLRYTAHGQFLYNLHVVISHRDGANLVQQEFLEKTSSMLERICHRRSILLAEAGLPANHLHLAVGVDVTKSPQEIALCFLNNLAYAHGNQAIYRHGAYVGTFGNYDLGAIWNANKAGHVAL